MTTLTLASAIFSLALSLTIFLLNPKRLANQTFALVFIVLTAWLACVYRAMLAGAMPSASRTTELEWWFRANAAVISLLPTSIWMLVYGIIHRDASIPSAAKFALPFFAISACSIYFCLDESFISHTSPTLLTRGSSYYFYIAATLSAFSICIVHIGREMRLQNGIRFVELQFLAMNAGGAALLIALLNALGNFLSIRALNKASVLLVLAGSVFTASALVFRRVFNAQEFVVQIGKQFSLSAILCICILITWDAFNLLLPRPFGLLAIITICGPAAVWLNRQFRIFLEDNSERPFAQVQHVAQQLAQASIQPEHLLLHLETLLMLEYRTNNAYIFLDKVAICERRNFVLDKQQLGLSTIAELGWATPESLQRMRSSPDISGLKNILTNNNLGILISVPRNSTAPTLILALESRLDDWPYTYREVRHLQQLAMLFENLLARAKLASQVSLNSKMEQLAMMSRALAHDLNNLVTPISTFLTNSAKDYSSSNPDSELHEAATTSLKVLSDYLQEALFFSHKQEAKHQPVDLALLCDTACSISRSRAASRNVQLTYKVMALTALNADALLIQRLLVNLLNNAIDASSHGQTVFLYVKSKPTGSVTFEVHDNGCGISVENAHRIFDPYFTTKNFGSELRGSGLGLAIGRHIAKLHDGTIFFRSEVGKGSIFTVELPTSILEDPAYRRSEYTSALSGS